jgi:hypothetical protein
MKSLIAALGLLAAAPAFATNYDCSTPRDEVHAFLVFDDGPGGLDDVQIEAWGTQYTDVLFGDEDKAILQLDTRDTSRGTFEYGGDKLEVGFTAPKTGIKLDLFAKKAKSSSDKLTGRVVVTGKKSTTTLSLTCKED